MVTTIGAAALILAAVIGTFVMWRLNKPAVQGTVTVVEKLRLYIGIVFMGILAYHLLRSGNLLYIIIAALAFAFLTGYALVERPWENTI